MSPRNANLLLLLAGATWGMGFIAQETAMDDMGPMLFIGFRFLLAGLVVLPFAIREQFKTDNNLSWKNFLKLAPVGVIFFLAMALQQLGLLATTVTKAGFLTALYVVFVPLILLSFLRERQAFIIWPASAIALFGIFLLSGGNITSLNWGDWLVIGCAVFWALHVILVGKVGGASGTPVTMACLQFFICGILGMAGHWVVPLFGVFEPDASWQIIMAALPEILYAGIFAGGLAFTLQAIGQQYTSEAAAAILLASESLFAAMFGAWFLGERLGVIGYVGCGLIFAALVLVELKPTARRGSVT
ncbi:MAG: DMT family transporter [Methylococcaceae bacterium]